KVEASPEAVKRTTQEQQTNANKQSKTQPVANQAASKKIESPIAEAASDGTVYHYIAAGDTLYSLAKKYGTTVEKLCELNDIKENTIMSVGRKIRCS
ncbi:MAG: LysM peptidoglycan-binding domain-containing protein, partial [Tannerella sp.]|nr:LysM peptidoglycan-binding domain-containing protein [Tannerella sp.]